MTASRARSSSIGSDLENARIGSSRFASAPSPSFAARAGAPWPLALRARLGLIVHHRIAQQADTRDFDVDFVARLQITRRIEAGASAARRPGEDHIAGLER